MSVHSSSSEITIIGAGIIGITIALSLQRSGFSTILVDRNLPASGCSSGNAGIIATYGVTPVSLPGLWKKVPKMLLDPIGPLTLRWQHLAKITPWLFKFWRAGNPQKVKSSANSLRNIVQNSLSDYQALTANTPARSFIKTTPLLCVFNHRSDFENDLYAWRLRQENGVKWTELNSDSLRALEPTLSTKFKFGLAIENTGFIINPKRFGETLFEEYIEHGGKYKQAELRGLESDGDQIALTFADGKYSANKVIVACGAWSGQLASHVGESIPIEAERGYHLTLSGFSGDVPIHPVMSPSHKVIATPMEMGLRIAGMAEFGGFLPPDYRRSTIMRRIFADLFPDLGGGSASQWMGHRPTLPDSLPVIGQSKRCANLYYAFGHQHVGITSAPMTARLITDMIAQRAPVIDLTPYRVDRF